MVVGCAKTENHYQYVVTVPQLNHNNKIKRSMGWFVVVVLRFLS